MIVAAKLQTGSVRGGHCAEGHIVLRGTVAEEIPVALEGGHVHPVPRHDSAAFVCTRIVPVDAEGKSNFVSFPGHGIHKCPNLPGTACDKIDSYVLVRVDVGPTGVRITRIGIWPFDVYTCFALVENFAVGSSGFTRMPTVEVTFTNVPIVVVNSELVAEAELLSVPDRHGVFGGCEINVVGILKYHGRQNMRVDTVLA